MRAVPAALLLLAGLLAQPASAEWIGPGDYEETGRVVRCANGSIELFRGHGCGPYFSETLQEELRQHVGSFVRVSYTRVSADDHPELALSGSGSPVGSIREIRVLAQGTHDLPLRIELSPTREVFAPGEPVEVRVKLTRQRDERPAARLRAGRTNVLQDYRWVAQLEPSARAQSNERGKTARRAWKTGARGAEELEFSVTSAHMLKPGSYELVYTLPADPVAIQSEPVTVRVREPRDAEEELAALRAWFARAEPDQRIAIGERLVGLGDQAAVARVLALFDEEATWGSQTYARLYRFAWRHGGADGEKRMLARLAAAQRQSVALPIIEEVSLSPRAIPLLRALLADLRPVWRDHSGWCERPRICDVTAAWLAGYTDGELSFPADGTQADRDGAVARVLAALTGRPELFSNLRAPR